MINQESVEKAVAMFEGADLNSAEALLASARLFTASLARLKREASTVRAEIGEERTRRFATEYLNEVIYDIQDSVPEAVRLYNSLMRDAQDAKGGPPE